MQTLPVGSVAWVLKARVTGDAGTRLRHSRQLSPIARSNATPRLTWSAEWITKTR